MPGMPTRLVVTDPVNREDRALASAEREVSHYGVPTKRATLALGLAAPLGCTIEVPIKYIEFPRDESTSCASGAQTNADESTGTGTGTGGSGSSFIEDPTGPSETEGGEDPSGRWYSPCFTQESDFSTCDEWCFFTGLGECAFIVLYIEGECASYEEGSKRLGLCDADIYEALPCALDDEYRWRCVCDGND